MASTDEKLPFSAICSLLNDLESLLERYKAPKTTLSRSEFRARQTKTIKRWHEYYKSRIVCDSTSVLAVLSLLFPELRRDRVYYVKEPKLAEILARVLGMGNRGLEGLRNWRLKHRDFGTAFENAMKLRTICTDESGLSAVEVNESLDRLVNRTEYQTRSDTILQSILQKCAPSQAKWLMRMILKSFQPELLWQYPVFTLIHPSLWNLWNMYSSYDTSNGRNSDLTAISQSIFSDDLVIAPRTGVPIQIPHFDKAHGCLHACKAMARCGDSCYVETKYDGERMQIHVNLSLPLDKQVQIFSKSRKDSTKDRYEVVPTIRKALGIGVAARFQERCILDAELVLWDDEEQRIQEFHKLRRHLKHKDGVRNPNLHLMAVFFDVLVIDDQNLLFKSYVERTKVLSEIIIQRDGWAILPSRFHLCLKSIDAACHILQSHMSDAIALREEGLVLKATNSPYRGRNGWMKLKKDYIPGLGDTLDFCIVGAGFDATRARDGIKAQQNVKWNTWHIGCLENKHQVVEENARPRFAVLFTASYNLTSYDMRLLNCRTTPIRNTPGETIDAGHFDITLCNGVRMMDAILETPVLVELMGAGFDIPQPGTDYILRWPRVVKVHIDRDWKEGVSRKELQDIARNAVYVGDENEKEEWRKVLGVVDRSHAASGTVVPSPRLIEMTRNAGVKSERRYGVEMKYGLDVDNILKKRVPLMERNVQTNLSTGICKKRRSESPDGSLAKRICSSVKSENNSASRFTNNLDPICSVVTFQDMERLLSSATVFAVTKSYHDEISRFIPTIIHLNISDLETSKENSVSAFRHHGDRDNVVLVDQFDTGTVRKVLKMVREMSIVGGRWHVSNWKIVQCTKLDTNIGWNSEHLWTYIAGIAY